MKVLTIGDIHLADKAPASCTDSYTDDLFDLLYQIIDIAVANDVDMIIPLGDIFHIKGPSKNSHRLVLKVLQWASEVRSKGIRIIGVAGNHDLSNDRLASLWEGQPLGILFKSGAFEYHEGWVDNLPIYVVHWLQDWDAQELVADRAVKDALHDWNENPKDTPALVVTHAPFFPPGADPNWESYDTGKFSRALQLAGQTNVSVNYGHIHDYFGEYNVNGVTFCNNGSLSRGSLTESHLTRRVGVTSWDSITGSFQFHELAVRPANEIFRVAEVTEKKKQQIKLDQFLASVGQSTIEITSIASVMDKIKSMKLGKEFETVVEELLTSV